jgi:serine protease inhibitor
VNNTTLRLNKTLFDLNCSLHQENASLSEPLTEQAFIEKAFHREWSSSRVLFIERAFHRKNLSSKEQGLTACFATASHPHQPRDGALGPKLLDDFWNQEGKTDHG